jgi:hypothetical protein
MRWTKRGSAAVGLLVGLACISTLLIDEESALGPNAMGGKLAALQEVCEQRPEQLSDVYLGYCVDHKFDAHPRIQLFRRERMDQQQQALRQSQRTIELQAEAQQERQQMKQARLDLHQWQLEVVQCRITQLDASYQRVAHGDGLDLVVGAKQVADDSSKQVMKGGQATDVAEGQSATLKLGYILELSPGLEFELVTRMFSAIYDRLNIYVVNVDFKNDEAFLFWAEGFFGSYNQSAGNIYLTTVRSSWDKIARVDVYGQAIRILLSHGAAFVMNLSGSDFPLKTQQQMRHFLGTPGRQHTSFVFSGFSASSPDSAKDAVFEHSFEQRVQPSVGRVPWWALEPPELEQEPLDLESLGNKHKGQNGSIPGRSVHGASMSPELGDALRSVYGKVYIGVGLVPCSPYVYP